MKIIDKFMNKINGIQVYLHMFAYNYGKINSFILEKDFAKNLI